MNFNELVKTRRSVRKYKDTPISKEDLLEILEAGTYAPSAVDLQPWYFVAVQSKEKMEKVKNIMKQVSADCAPSLKERFKAFPEVADDSIGFIKMLGNAPVVVLAFLNKSNMTKTDAPMVESVSAGIQNILLAAADKGIASCWLTAPLKGPASENSSCWLAPPAESENAKRFREEFAPDRGELIAIITLGYAEVTPKAPKRKTRRFEIV